MARGTTEMHVLDDLSLSAAPYSQPWEFVKRGYYDLTPPAEPASDTTEEVDGHLDAVSSLEEPLIAVIGVGYVGEHLIKVFSAKCNVIGYDTSSSRVKQLSAEFADSDKVRFTNNASELRMATHLLIAVPTLLLPDRTIDSSYLRSALKSVGLHARRGAVVIVESSVAVGMTRELLGPLAAEKGFFAGMSPERVDPGRAFPPAHTIPKVVSGLDDVVPGSLDAVLRLYREAFDQVVPVSQPEVAEMTKLYENCQRMVCIAYANEMADACVAHGIDPFEVCKAAASKPFGYLPLAPGAGVGGHCIPVNPHYLLSNCDFPMLREATERMRARPAEIARRAVDELVGRGSRRPKVLVVGIGFKAGQSHLINSPGLELAKSLALTDQVDVMWADPLVDAQAVPQLRRFADVDWNAGALETFDLIMIAMRQRELDFRVLQGLQNARVQMLCP